MNGINIIFKSLKNLSGAVFIICIICRRSCIGKNAFAMKTFYFSYYVEIRMLNDTVK